MGSVQQIYNGDYIVGSGADLSNIPNNEDFIDILLRINGNFGIFLIPIAVTCDEDFVKSVDRIAK